MVILSDTTTVACEMSQN